MKDGLGSPLPSPNWAACDLKASLSPQASGEGKLLHEG